MRVLVDTNVLVSAFLLTESVPRRLVDRCLADCDLVTSIQMVIELDDVLSRPKIAKKATAELARRFVDLYKRASILAEVKTEVAACRDPKDDHILAAAFDGGADLIVTGDADLLSLDPFRGIRILTPADALVLFAA